MPTVTFANLPDAKRRAFIAAALEEFSAREFELASVSRIVAKLGMAKGSVYQYFADKQDLYRYLVEHAQSVLMGSLARDDPAPGGDFFTTLRHLMEQTVVAARLHPREAALLERAYRSPESLTDEFHARTVGMRRTYLGDLVERAQHSGELRSDADASLITLLVETLVSQIGPWLDARLPHGGPERYDDERTRSVFDQAIAILKDGLGRWGPDRGV